VVSLAQKFRLRQILHHSLCDLAGVFKNKYGKNSMKQTLEHYIYCDSMSQEYTCWAILDGRGCIVGVLGEGLIEAVIGKRSCVLHNLHFSFSLLSFFPNMLHVSSLFSPRKLTLKAKFKEGNGRKECAEICLNCA
jgi:hypothetical protein